MPGPPWTSWIGLTALLAITVLIGFDTMTSEQGEVFLLGLRTLATIPFFALVPWLGWQRVKHNEPKNALFSGPRCGAGDGLSACRAVDRMPAVWNIYRTNGR